MSATGAPPCPGADTAAIAAASDTIGSLVRRAHPGEYDDVRVLTPNSWPRIPVPLRKARGSRGEALATFIIDTVGRVEPASIVMVHSSSGLWSTSVCRSLLETRYAPIVRDGRAVRTRLYVPFSYHVDP